MRRAAALAALLAAAAPPAAAESRVLAATAAPDPAETAFVAANLVFMIHHEAAHALIDLLALPVPEGEEEAADTLSAVLIERLRPDEAAAGGIVRGAVRGFALYAAEAGAGAAAPFRDRHAPDALRRDRLACLFYGANPDDRADLAEAADLTPDDRRTCPTAFALAADRWGALLEGMPPQDHGPRLRLVVPAGRDGVTATVAAEVEALNGEFGLPAFVDVTVERCGEANAFYDPRARRIVACTEYAEDLSRLWRGRGVE